MESKIFPFLKSWNKKAKSKLAFADIIKELKDIKLVELNLRRSVDTIKILEPITPAAAGLAISAYRS